MLLRIHKLINSYLLSMIDHFIDNQAYKGSQGVNHRNHLSSGGGTPSSNHSNGLIKSTSVLIKSKARRESSLSMESIEGLNISRHKTGI